MPAIATDDRSGSGLPGLPTRVFVVGTDLPVHGEFADEPGITLVDNPADADVLVALVGTPQGQLPEGYAGPLLLIADERGPGEPSAGTRSDLIMLVPRGDVTTSGLIKILADARRDRRALPAKQAGRVLRVVSDPHPKFSPPRDRTAASLSGREIDVLRLLADGLETTQISAQLCCAERIVKDVLYGLLTRLNLRNRTQAVAYAIRHGLI